MRRLAFALLLLVALSAPSVATSGRWERVACGMPREEIQRIFDGYHPERSGDVQLVPDAPNFVGTFASHSGPWDYLQEVPLLLVGPGHVPAVGRVDRPVTVADMAPTYADMIGFDFAALDGAPLTEAVTPGAAPPRLILTVVWDGGGRNVLRSYPKSWPTLKRLVGRGAWFEHATVGSSPSTTPAIHSSIGTGAFPRHHGIVDLRFRIGDRKPTSGERASLLIGPTLADEYDVRSGNTPVIGMVGSEGTLGMIGHGAGWEGGDRDIAAAQRAGLWRLSGGNQETFSFPPYIEEIPGYGKIRPAADRQDGKADGDWFGLELNSAEALSHTPAYTRYQTTVVEELIRREGFGDDGVTDLLYVNYKQIDKVGHKFSFPGPQMGAVVRGVDQALGSLVQILDREVGAGQWVVALTADHGSTPKPQKSGGTIIDQVELFRDLQREFDGSIQSLRPTQLWVDRERLRRTGHSLEEISTYLLGYTRGENAIGGSGSGGQRLLSAAFPSSVLSGLPCVRE